MGSNQSERDIVPRGELEPTPPLAGRIAVKLVMGRVLAPQEPAAGPQARVLRLSGPAPGLCYNIIDKIV